MKALVQLAYGSPGGLALQQVAQPVARSGDLVVQVCAASLNAADRLLLRGEPYAIRAMAGGLRRPRSGFVVGRALSGRVVAVGDDVEGFAVGDDVLAETGAAIGEFARVPARLAALKPVGLSFIEAAALPLAGTTALQGLRAAAAIRRGARVLVTGASGGVGTFAVQLAVARGAGVTAVCAGRAAEMMRSLGATQIIDYEQGRGDDVGELGERFEAILDLAGNYPLAALRRALAPGGTLVLSVGTGGRWFGPMRRILKGATTGGGQVRTLTAHPSPEDLSELAGMVATGQIRPVIDRVYPLEDAAAAVDRIDRGPVAGKIVVAVTASPD
ncbi:NAD(P)-dependent alcohol dehydrogenase [Actinoplanes sp. NEAU-A12]|uniref:NAD(P)-dependent alcohol dehydrogenase n=1 Tax=Actinoplanes sandaracinus TaxID=3045177 RepID=A0ABT6X196_9ACTN|nr:NAD(P)-dependent alcohol dehydrogenase [Actinoplanes sandaracinus]MDI6105694.1 NAD(P)-dependent alcohol dehydrogenase [Actinoplanes sandaracinus]